jgi:hypothetical protein
MPKDLTRDNEPLRGTGMRFCMALLLAPRLAPSGKSDESFRNWEGLGWE